MYVKYLGFFQCTQHIKIVTYIFVVVFNWPKFKYEQEPPFIDSEYTFLRCFKICWVHWKERIKCNNIHICICCGRAFVRPVTFMGGLLSALSFSLEGFLSALSFLDERALVWEGFCPTLIKLPYTNSEIIIVKSDLCIMFAKCPHTLSCTYMYMTSQSHYLSFLKNFCTTI
jgi:hypothetical protein